MRSFQLSLLVAGASSHDVFDADGNAVDHAHRITSEYRGGGHDHEESEYLDPHGHHDIDIEYIATYAKANEGQDCLVQCETLQAMNTNPHYSQLFCYSAAAHGWTPNNPTWEVRMEVRCQEGHWANKMNGYRKRREDGEDEDESEVERGSGHSHGGGDKGEPGIQAYGNDGNVWEYKPRWFYCNEGKWISKQNTLDKLKHGRDVKEHAACAHAHRPPNFKNGCNVETYDFGSGQYHCRYDTHDHGHKHYNYLAHDHQGHHHHGGHNHVWPYHRKRRDVEDEEGEDRGWDSHGYEKICQVQCAWPSIPRRLLSDGSADEIVCDTRTGKWKNGKGPEACDEPYGRGHQCHTPYGDEHGTWDCHGPHGNQGKHDHDDHGHGHGHGHHHGRKRRDDGDDASAEDEDDRHLSFSTGHIGHGVGHGHYINHGHVNHGHGHHHGHGHNHGHYGHDHHNHYHQNGFYTALHAMTTCKLTCDPGYVSSTCQYEFSCDPTTWPSWGPAPQPPMCVPTSVKQCPRDCTMPPGEVENGRYTCVRMQNAWKTECSLKCDTGLNHRGLEYTIEYPKRGILECNSDDLWVAPAANGDGTCTDVDGAGRSADECWLSTDTNAGPCEYCRCASDGTVTCTDDCDAPCESALGTMCIEAPSKCPTTQTQIDDMFDAGTGGSWDVKINGGFAEVALKCEKGYRPEVWAQQVSKCSDGSWEGTLSRCVEDKDYCMDAHPQNEDKATINGQWECTKTTGTGAQVTFQHARTGQEDEDGDDRGYTHGHGHGHGHGHHHHGHSHSHASHTHKEAEWHCTLKCDNGFQAVTGDSASCTDGVGATWDVSPFPVCTPKPVCDIPEGDACTEWDCSTQFYAQKDIVHTGWHHYHYMPHHYHKHHHHHHGHHHGTHHHGTHHHGTHHHGTHHHNSHHHGHNHAHHHNPALHTHNHHNHHNHHHHTTPHNHHHHNHHNHHNHHHAIPAHHNHHGTTTNSLISGLHFHHLISHFQSHAHISAFHSHGHAHHHHLGRRDAEDDAADDRWEWGENLQEIQRCIPLCKNDCINVSGAPAFNCFVETATWDMPPFRCCPDVHKLQLTNEDNCDDIAHGTAFPVMVKETWTTAAGDDGSTLTEVEHGSYMCDDYVDVQIPFVTDSWYGRKRRSDDSEPEAEFSSDETDERHHLLDHTHHADHTHTHHTHNHHHHTHHHHHTDANPTHPSHVAGQEKSCTLTCTNDEVSATGSMTATCQIVNGVHKWTNRITNCVNADDMLAELTTPAPAAPVSSPSSSGPDKGGDHGAGGHSHGGSKKKKNKGDKKNKKEGKKNKKADKKSKKEGKKKKKAEKKKKKKERQEARGML